jgi:rhodanese-related sulfurtransferase
VGDEVKKHLSWALALLACAGVARAELNAMIAVEPTSKQDSFMVKRDKIEEALAKASGQSVKVSISEDLSDVMRATRAGEFDVYIAPPQIAASALLRGFELVGSTEQVERFVLVGRAHTAGIAYLRGGALYLPSQDSIYTYVARGMLNAAGLSFKDMGRIEHARYPGAGLVAVRLGYADATVVRMREWETWSAAERHMLKPLATSLPVPGGLSVVVRKDLPAAARDNIVRWFAVSGRTAGVKPLDAHADLAQYKAVAELGFFTPTVLPGATVVTAKEVQELIAAGATVVDTRTEREYKAKHIPTAILIPYHEKSLKDIAFDGAKDDFSEIKQLTDKEAPTVFACNGAECWKSYKASKTAVAAGFKKVYWFRGGLPEWEASGLRIETAAAKAS